MEEKGNEEGKREKEEGRRNKINLMPRKSGGEQAINFGTKMWCDEMLPIPDTAKMKTKGTIFATLI